MNDDTPVYDLVVGATTRERSFRRALIRQASIEPGHHVLDVGSGIEALSCSLPYPSLHFDRALSSLFFHHLTTANKQRTVDSLALHSAVKTKLR